MSWVEMVRIELPDGQKKSFCEERVPVGELINSLGECWRREAVAAEFNGRVFDLHQSIEGEGTFKVLLSTDRASLTVLRHSTSHLLAYAVKKLFPEAKLGIGPPIEDGFYYDFSVAKPFTPDDLEKIEAKMREILEESPPIHREEWKKEKALRFFASEGEDYKVELIEDIPEGQVSIYAMGDFIDLCAGPHLESTHRIKAFKVLSSAGAYWRGDSARPMLQRIYATAFFKRKDLDEYLKRVEEAEKRDHRKLGKALGLFEVIEEAGGGLVFWNPRGAVIRDVIEEHWKGEHRKRGYELVFTPHIARADLWRTSGHYDYYRDNMYTLDVEGNEYVLKPMNCPGHILIYKRRLYSYRDLPVRFAEMGTVYRRELSGTLHGLLRVRGFTQDDAHIFCSEDQVHEEVEATLDFAIQMLADFGFEECMVELSLHDAAQKKMYAGNGEEWEMAEQALEEAIKRSGHAYERKEGEAVFYGPKIDVKVIDAIGRPWQLSTIQFDFNLPKRFDVTYIARNGERKQVFMVHRALLGSLERFVGILTEHYGGAFPLWLSPIQCLVLPVSSDDTSYALEVLEELVGRGIRAEVDKRDEKIGYRIRDAEMQKVPYMLVVGKREAASREVSVRARGRVDLGTKKLDEFAGEMVDEARPKR